jgi:branched-chain amino acid transport system ATP-binding protein
MQSPILTVQNINKRFGGLVAIENVSFEVQQNEVVGFLGPNGAGKSTLINIVAGDLSPDSGKVLYKDQDVSRLPLYQKFRSGLSRTYQIPQPFGNLSVRRNVAVAAMYGLKMGKHAAEAKAQELLTFTGLEDKSDFFARDLEEISLKRLELARSLASDPKLLMIDELAGGLTDKEIPKVIELLKSINEMGVTIVLIEHVMKVMMKSVSRIIVMEEGGIIAEGDPVGIMENPKVIEAYFG